MFQARLNGEKLKSKNFDELFAELKKYYYFNTLQELSEILQNLNIKLIIKIN